MEIFAINCGSSSVKYQLFDWDKRRVIAKGLVERVAIGGSFIVHEVPGNEKLRKEHDCPDHIEAIDLIIQTLTDPEHGVLKEMGQIAAVGHRVVHGGEEFTSSVLIDDHVLDGIRKVQHLAPLHNPPNIAGIEAARAKFPGVPHIAIFDSAFHQTMPERAFVYPLPYEWYEKYGIRRYGFHGTSHLFVSKRAALLLGKPAEECNMITMHIGNGVSHAAIKNGISVDTSMGFTPLEGAVMGTRCGDIDPAILLFMMEMESLDTNEIRSILNKKSGILGITKRFSDRRDVIKQSLQGDRLSALALEIEAYRLKKYIGSYTAILGKPDAVVFTAGAGERGWQLREAALEGLEHMGINLDKERNREAVNGDELLISTEDSPVKIFVIPTNEELVVIEDVAALLEGTYGDHMNFEYSFSRSDYLRPWHGPNDLQCGEKIDRQQRMPLIPNACPA